MSNYDIVIKKVKPFKVVSIRETLPHYSAIDKLFNELSEYLHQNEIKQGSYSAAIWHDHSYKESDVDSEAVISIDSSLISNERIQVYELPGWEAMACTIHQGSYKTISYAYNALLAWIQANSYIIIGPYHEFYIQEGDELDNGSYITEIQVPVAKIAVS